MNASLKSFDSCAAITDGKAFANSLDMYFEIKETVERGGHDSVGVWINVDEMEAHGRKLA